MSESVLTGIVEKLESKGTFKEIVGEILAIAQEQLKTSNAMIMQISSDNTEISTVVEYGTEGSNEFKDVHIKMDKFVVGSDSIESFNVKTCHDAAREILDMLGVKMMVTVPIYINDQCAMYYVVCDKTDVRDFDEEELQFMTNVSRIIQSIAQKRVTKHSLESSYEVLREILGRIVSGIIVFSKQDGSVLFENDVAHNSEEVKRTIKECASENVFNKDSEGYDKRPVEHYDAESGLWFEVKFSRLTWIDGSDAIVCTAIDITQKKKNQQKIEYQANCDFLTGLYNRMKCESDLRDIMKVAVDNGEQGAVMFIDLDNFKHINDGLGHQYGDILLQQIAAGLQSIPGLRGNCYRMGGDEFLIIIKPRIYSDIQRVIKNVMAMFNKPWYLMGTEYFCTMSMGVAVFPDNSTDVHEIVKMADMAMYDAKKSGKNQSGFYDGSKNRNSTKKLDIENNMRQAIATELQEFVVFYQPVVDTFTKECTSCEALVRWDSKALGFMGPGEFIPLAEYLGLITDIGDYVLEEACKQCKIWNDMGYTNFHINVNLSVVQLLQKNAVDNIGRIISKTGVDPHNIVLEITESFAINDMERVMKIIDGLKALGPRIALDDFGTGYSSLNYIKQLPLNIIKVDKTFIDDIVEDEYAQAFVKLIVDLSKTIKTQIVVEGVELEEQYEVLKDIGVNYIQGFLFGKPVNAREFERMHLRKEA